MATGNTVGVRGQAMVVLTKDKARAGFRILFDARGKDVLLDMQAECEISGRKVPFSMSGLTQVNAFLVTNKAMQSKGGRKPSAEQSQALKMAEDQLKALGDLGAELNQKATIPFRVYAVLGQADDEASPKVVIFESGQSEDLKAAGPKKNAKGKPLKGHLAPEKDDSKL